MPTNVPFAFFKGQYLPATEVALSVTDAGFVQGVAVSEQMRTFGGSLFRLEEHLARLGRSLEIVGVDPGMSLVQLAEAAQELVSRNLRLQSEGDELGLSLFVTPGDYPTFATSPPEPTVCLHTYPVPFHQWAEKYDSGQPLRVSSVQQVDPQCWPVELKCRSRMHYYLADRDAAQQEPGARAILLDRDSLVVEASTANLIAYRAGEGLISPPLEKILPGVTLSVFGELAGQLQIPFVFRDLTVGDLSSSQELFLTSTSPCILPVSTLNGEPLGSQVPGPVFLKLLAAWNELVGFDIREQAQQLAARRRSAS